MEACKAEQFMDRRSLFGIAHAGQHLRGDGAAQRQLVGQCCDQSRIGFAVANPESRQVPDQRVFISRVGVLEPLAAPLPRQRSSPVSRPVLSRTFVSFTSAASLPRRLTEPGPVPNGRTA